MGTLEGPGRRGATLESPTENIADRGGMGGGQASLRDAKAGGLFLSVGLSRTATVTKSLRDKFPTGQPEQTTTEMKPASEMTRTSAALIWPLTRVFIASCR